MKLVPKYSYEYNCMLNKGFSEDEQIRNFASLISDKDRFLLLLTYLEKNLKLISKKSGFKLREEIEFYIVRAEKFKSFSEPITVEYSLLPEEMICFLIKEIVKVSSNIRFPDEITREIYVNSFVDYITINGDFGDYDLVKFGKNLHDESLNIYSHYIMKDIDFSNSTLKKHIEDMYNEN